MSTKVCDDLHTGGRIPSPPPSIQELRRLRSSFFALWVPSPDIHDVNYIKHPKTQEELRKRARVSKCEVCRHGCCDDTLPRVPRWQSGLQSTLHPARAENFRKAEILQVFFCVLEARDAR